MREAKWPSGRRLRLRLKKSARSAVAFGALALSACAGASGPPPIPAGQVQIGFTAADSTHCRLGFFITTNAVQGAEFTVFLDSAAPNTVVYQVQFQRDTNVAYTPARIPPYLAIWQLIVKNGETVINPIDSMAVSPPPNC